ncbi:MAG TPA: NUDIX hydrolase [Thermomicrobiales bacterium]|nr:NUDIX hydrolase [Thermomicrobiales bacterium]
MERVELPEGRVVDEYPWIRTRDFAMAVAMTPEGRVVLERSYKHGPRRVALSVPAGYIEVGERSEQTARRELREETGYTSDDWQSLGEFTVDGNYGVCAAYIFLASDARRTVEAGGFGHDDLEPIEVLTLPLDDALAAITRGEIAQLSSAAALGLAAAKLADRL